MLVYRARNQSPVSTCYCQALQTTCKFKVAFHVRYFVKLYHIVELKAESIKLYRIMNDLLWVLTFTISLGYNHFRFKVWPFRLMLRILMD